MATMKMEEEFQPIASETKKRVRKLKEKWTAEQTERLIQEVKVREGTWNIFSPQYRNRKLRAAQWQDVADVLNMPRSEVSAKWNSLRGSFRAAFNRKGTVRSIAFNSLKFLEPTLQIEANRTSNYPSKCSSPLSSLVSPCDTDVSVESDDSTSTPPKQSTSQVSVLRRRVPKDDDGFSEVVEGAMETMSTAAKSDAWGDVGNFVASNGREWAIELPHLAREFKADLYDLVLKYQQRYNKHHYILEGCSLINEKIQEHPNQI